MSEKVQEKHGGQCISTRGRHALDLRNNDSEKNAGGGDVSCVGYLALVLSRGALVTTWAGPGIAQGQDSGMSHEAGWEAYHRGGRRGEVWWERG